MIFIRPLFLLLLLVPFVYRFMKKRQLKKSPWTKWVDKALLPYLLIQSGKSSMQSLWSKWLIILWSLLVMAAAGPAFQKLPVPVSYELPNTVFILDLGPTMQNTALATAKIKLNDFLTALKGNRVGLVLYADKGYVALPLTQDRALLRSLIPTLDNSVLPNTGQNLAAAFQKANELIQQTGGNGRILYLTAGGVEAKGIETPYPVGVLGLDNSAISSTLKHLGSYHAKTADASDVLELIAHTEPDTASVFQDDLRTDQWADLAGIIVLMILPFFALTFRKGFLFVLLLSTFSSAHASFFLRPDQEAYRQQEQAVADYRAGNYEGAIQGFQNHAYNLGNALAYAGQIQQAIQSYAQALIENPDDEDARFNKEYLEKQLPPPDQDQQNQQQQQQENNANQDESDQNEQNQQDQPTETEQDQSDQQPDSNDQQNQPIQQDQSNEQEDQMQPREVDESQREQSPFNQQEQQILNRLQSDPYRVLRYRLLQQARQK